MRVEALLRLQEPLWVTVQPDRTLRCKIIPAMAAAAGGLAYAPTNETIMRTCCTQLFVDFDGLVDAEGKPERNTIERRMQLLLWPPCRMAIVEALAAANQDAAEGEDCAASELPGTD